MMGLAIFWLACLAVFLELADRAPEIEPPGRCERLDSQPENVAARAPSFKTATGDHASS